MSMFKTATKLSLCRLMQMRVLEACPSGLQADPTALEMFRNLCVKERELECKLVSQANIATLSGLQKIVFEEAAE